jgi:DNA mismatch endonuclease (patch repair protein)
MDRLTPERRSWLMSRVRGYDTKPELDVRRALHALGYRYRLHVKSLPGRPDLVFAKRHKIVMVHGCFWHSHECRAGRATSKSNVPFWKKKMTANKMRDRLVVRQLKSKGWRIHTIWECQIKRQTWIEATIDFLEQSGEGVI